MFKKPFRVKTQSVMKGSDRKKLRAEILKAFKNLSQDNLAEIIPNKEEVTVTKINSHAGDNVFIYSVNKQPMLFEIDKEKILYPTVYLLWRYTDLVHRFTTWPPVFNKMKDGADLMLPGLIVREPVTPATFKHIEKFQLCSVNLLGNRAPVSIGFTLLSGSDFFDSGMKGKGVHAVHLLGDELWAFGDKSSPPDLGDDPLLMEAQDGSDSEEDTDQLGCNDDLQVETTGADSETNGDLQGEVTGAGGATCEEEIMSRVNDLVVDDGDIENGDLKLPDNEDGDTTEENNLTPDQMNELFHFCFLCAIKSSLKKSDLPINTGSFFKQHMTKFCPVGKQLDIKKSTYKKLSKFLQHEEQLGIIRIKQVSKGVDNIVELDKSHEELRGFVAPEPVQMEEATASQTYVPPKITELFAISANTLPIFKEFGHSKGTAFKGVEVRNVLTEYVKKHELQSEQDKGEVVLDPILAEILLKPAEGDKSTLRWDAMYSRLLGKMTSVNEIKVFGQAPVIRKGTLDPIKIDVLQRASNKKVTTVENIDQFGIDPKEFGHTVQVKKACSSSVSPHQQKGKGPVVTVQGNQVNFLADLLIETYKIPKRYIRGLDKAPKSKRR